MNAIKSKPVVTIPKNNREDLWFCLDEFQGKDRTGKLSPVRNVCNIRVFANTKTGVRPTNKGLTISPELLTEFIRGAEALKAEAVSRGWLKVA